MGRKKHSIGLILMFLALITLHSSASAIHHDDDRFSLQGLREVLVAPLIIYSKVEFKPAWLNEHRLRMQLRKGIERKLKMAGIKALKCSEWLTIPRKPILWVSILITQDGQYMYEGKVYLDQNVCLEREPAVGTFFITTWSHKARGGGLPFDEEKIRDFGIGILDVFIEAHHFANSGEKDFSLFSFGCIENVDTTIKKLNHKDPHVRGSAVLSLGEIKDSSAVEPLIAMLNDEHREVRSWAATALGNQEDSRAVGPLISALKDEYYTVRLLAAEALGKIKNSRAVEPLIEVLEKDKGQIICLATWALKEITGQNFGYNAQEWRNWWRESKQKFPKGR